MYLHLLCNVNAVQHSSPLKSGFSLNILESVSPVPEQVARSWLVWKRYAARCYKKKKNRFLPIPTRRFSEKNNARLKALTQRVLRVCSLQGLGHLQQQDAAQQLHQSHRERPAAAGRGPGPDGGALPGEEDQAGALPAAADL